VRDKKKKPPALFVGESKGKKKLKDTRAGRCEQKMGVKGENQVIALELQKKRGKERRAGGGVGREGKKGHRSEGKHIIETRTRKPALDSGGRER